MDWIELGYLGMFVSSFLAATVLPLGSEVVFVALLASGYNPFVLTFTASAGNTLGGMLTYYIGRLGQWEWIEKWFHISHAKVEGHMQGAQKYGWLYAFFTWLPGVGDIMAIAIGFARVHPITAFIWMALGKTLRFGVIAYLYLYSIDLFS